MLSDSERSKENMKITMKSVDMMVMVMGTDADIQRIMLRVVVKQMQ